MKGLPMKGEGWKGPHNPCEGPGARKDGEAVKAAMTKALAVLTAQQAVRWKEMIGEPFAEAFTIHLPGPLGPPGLPGPGFPPFPRFGPFGQPKK
jgi:hypothetical protein